MNNIGWDTNCSLKSACVKKNVYHCTFNTLAERNVIASKVCNIYMLGTIARIFLYNTSALGHVQAVAEESFVKAQE